MARRGGWSSASRSSSRWRPGHGRHRAGDQVEITFADPRQGNLVLVNLANDGTVQLIAPGPDAADVRYNGTIIAGEPFKLPVQVVPPFGTDDVLAPVSREPLKQVIDFLRRKDGRIADEAFAEMLLHSMAARACRPPSPASSRDPSECADLPTIPVGELNDLSSDPSTGLGSSHRPLKAGATLMVSSRTQSRVRLALALLLAGWLALPADGNAAWIFCRYGPGNSRCVTSCPASARVHGRFATKQACQGAKIARMRSKGLLPPEASQTPRTSAAKKPPPSRKPATTAAKAGSTAPAQQKQAATASSAAELATATSAAVQAMVDANAILPKMEPGGLGARSRAASRASRRL